MPPYSKDVEGKNLELHCVTCGWAVKRLFMQYSPGNIRLMKCENCKSIADPYIECEFMIVLIDLILHKREAYRHVLYNTLNQDAFDIKGILWKSILVYFLLDAWRSLLFNSSENWDSFRSLLSLLWTCEKILVDVSLGSFMFISVLLIGTRVLLNSSPGISRYKDILLAILISSYFKLFLLAMLAWEFSLSVIFIVDVFVLSSNAVALRVLTESSTIRCIGVCCSAYAAKFFVNHLLSLLFSDVK